MPVLLTQKPFPMHSLVVHAAKLPPSPQVYGRLVAAINDSSSSLEHMADLVRLDAAISSQLLRLANSALFGFRSPADNVEEAVLRIGLKELRRIVGLSASLVVFQGDMKLYATQSSAIWTNAVATGVSMEKIAGISGADTAQAYTAGLLRSIGKMILARHAGGTVAPYPNDGTPLPEWEKQVFSCTHAQIGSAVCEIWRFPKPIVEGLRDHLDPSANPEANQLAHLLHLAGHIVDRIGHGQPGESSIWAEDPARLAKTGFDEPRIAALCEEISAEMQQMGEMLEIVKQK
jgi:HD-like signal output (HDOD) protein